MEKLKLPNPVLALILAYLLTIIGSSGQAQELLFVWNKVDT
ncbi:hypothetical protein F907_02189 [Acinetobacter colistiniresistens]|uniref:Uncharacterized protein n=1 Tax=Acinetobacter colistiniresistens TaxID=280145 RepID=S3UFI7_9GAMM|nr:hypothetical protein F907_02189 [Acinetobacter colistiniresistens]